MYAIYGAILGGLICLLAEGIVWIVNKVVPKPKQWI